jgi:hypothetical protein
MDRPCFFEWFAEIKGTSIDLLIVTDKIFGSGKAVFIFHQKRIQVISFDWFSDRPMLTQKWTL